ncbi:hypothetical protein FRIGORI9N_400117 [Frigoribacterium sp. 9N]|nr:hypothetical protein FRIGORI9N_400117 [Frigoribacterium sp. 9N]
MAPQLASLLMHASIEASLVTLRCL